MPIKAIDGSEPILGYALKERIGAGGYGEVWAAEAPGGLAKAIKFIYGYHDENRAQRELKALNRIKEVRHPFLLSLERIDIVDGQLVVITELADMSLKDRFDQCVEMGLKGIPRGELLGYMRDAADALDYISVEHRLQHLDIKPENLLLVSGHVKVADYGLVKDIHDGTQSMMGGLTPAFAPPELFDGRPSKSSDQYSLAIVFQEMLTGERPFSGTTAAQLASQHMKERPRLSCLPRDDQSVISRALGKDPELRYPSCRAMVDELTQRSGRSSATPRKAPVKKKGKSKDGTPTSSVTMQLPNGAQPFSMGAVEVQKLPPVDVVYQDAKMRPTLFIGVGHTGTQIVRTVRRRLFDRLGSESTPSIGFLCMDTDRRDLSAATRGDDHSALKLREIFEFPLRRSEDYRNDAKMHLSWLSRRWIYNVPRSLQTEGIRPLGRLAFADHHASLYVKLRQLLSDLVLPERLAETAESVGMEPLDHPRVVIVGSISGGTFSGMGIDLAYAVKMILKELDVDEEDVIGLLTHSGGRSAADRNLSVANSLAFLNELYHYSCVDDYPGDPTCSLEAVQDDGATFGSAYFVDFGDDLLQKEFEAATESIAEYLHLSVATPCAAFLDACRSDLQERDGLPLRSLGIARTGGVAGDIVIKSAQWLARDLVQGWLGDSNYLDQLDATDHAIGHLAAVGLTMEELLKRTHQSIVSSHGNAADSLVETLLPLVATKDRKEQTLKLRHAVEKHFGGVESSETTPPDTAIDQMAANWKQEISDSFRDRIAGLVNEPSIRFGGARSILQAAEEQIQAHKDQFVLLRQSTEEKLTAAEDRLHRRDGVSDVQQFVMEYAELHVHRITLLRAEQLAEGMQSIFPTVLLRLEGFANQLQELARALPQIPDDRDEGTKEGYLLDPSDLEAEQNPVRSLLKCQRKLLAERRKKLVHRVDQQLQHVALDQAGGLAALLNSDGGVQSLIYPLHEASRTTIVEELKETDLDQFLTADDDLLEGVARWLHQTAQPSLLSCGGATRLLLAIPRSCSSSKLGQKIFDQTEQMVGTIPATVGEFVMCYEVEQLPLSNVVMQMLHRHPGSIEFASRLHARTDISWSPVTALR